MKRSRLEPRHCTVVVPVKQEANTGVIHAVIGERAVSSGRFGPSRVW